MRFFRVTSAPISAPSFPRLVLSRPAASRRRKKTWHALLHHAYDRHRQTPDRKHDKKTRHVWIAHVAQPSYSAFCLEIGDFIVSVIRCVAYVGGCCHPPLADSASCVPPVPGRHAPGSMGKIKCHALSARHQNYTTPPLQMASAGF